VQLLGRLEPRDPGAPHRSSTPLELFFDLTVVVAVAQAADGLELSLSNGQIRNALVGYPLVFFAIWWAWMNLTWFSSAYDNDDVAYRCAVLVQMIGVLVLAAGIPRAFNHFDFNVMVLGYVIMRLAMVSLWLRAAKSVPATRRCTLRYALGIGVVQVGWVAWLSLPLDIALPSFAVLALLELAVPMWAESVARTSWHPGHIAERYGLFTIIVLGQILLVTSLGIRSALDQSSTFAELGYVVAGGILTVFSMWWMYFDLPAGEIVTDTRHAFSKHITGAFAWGYGHYLVFGSAAATGAGLGLAIDQVTHHSELSRFSSGLALTIPVAFYLLIVWILHYRYKRPSIFRTIAVPIGIALIVASSATPQPVLWTGVVMLALVVVSVAMNLGDQEEGTPEVD
jgi:low temperature requirement protein LtrA